jgi:nitrite reductase/ring-hydroxylating ferredoxin subunit
MKSKIAITSVSKLEEMLPLYVKRDGVPYCIVKFEGQVRAFISICSHEYREFVPKTQGNCIVCPFHQVCFDAATGEVSDNRTKRVPAGLFPVSTEIRNGLVFINVEDEHRCFAVDSEARYQQRRAEKRKRRWYSFLLKGVSR